MGLIGKRAPEANPVDIHSLLKTNHGNVPPLPCIISSGTSGPLPILLHPQRVATADCKSSAHNSDTVIVIPSSVKDLTCKIARPDPVCHVGSSVFGSIFRSLYEDGNAERHVGSACHMMDTTMSVQQHKKSWLSLPRMTVPSLSRPAATPFPSPPLHSLRSIKSNIDTLAEAPSPLSHFKQPPWSTPAVQYESLVKPCRGTIQPCNAAIVRVIQALGSDQTIGSGCLSHYTSQKPTYYAKGPTIDPIKANHGHGGVNAKHPTEHSLRCSEKQQETDKTCDEGLFNDTRCEVTATKSCIHHSTKSTGCTPAGPGEMALLSSSCRLPSDDRPMDTRSHPLVTSPLETDLRPTVQRETPWLQDVYIGQEHKQMTPSIYGTPKAYATTNTHGTPNHPRQLSKEQRSNHSKRHARPSIDICGLDELVDRQQAVLSTLGPREQRFVQIQQTMRIGELVRMSEQQTLARQRDALQMHNVNAVTKIMVQERLMRLASHKRLVHLRKGCGFEE
ncbi:hypothetical protein BASA60_009679 [Batrachochytrium salamandrivorans]|nr:hypothetical protein BASA60_009679 [Batrachochytrium salamandrivorans]KAH6573629.1 hypothetical protein BASA62_002843 [Batrachochytrium salamandrivorans]